MRVRVLYFAQARDLSGVASEDLEVPEGSSVGSVVRSVLATHAELAALLGEGEEARSAAAVAVDGEYAAGWAAAVRDGAEIAILPPVSGG
jgi:molybdopterin converting factor subunit 1